jgi:hypothetical protein
LTHDEAGKQRARDGPETKRSDMEVSDPVTRGDDQEQREFGIANQELLDPGKHCGLLRDDPKRETSSDFQKPSAACSSQSAQRGVEA